MVSCARDLQLKKGVLEPASGQESVLNLWTVRSEENTEGNRFKIKVLRQHYEQHCHLVVFEQKYSQQCRTVFRQ